MGHSIRWACWLLIAWPGSGVALAESAPASGATVLLPVGIADASGATGFFASAGGGIEAVDLATGKLLWETNEAQRPLLVVGNHLLAQAGLKRNRLRILRLDLTCNGECDLESDPVVFPAWVVTGEAPGHSFSAHWHLEKHQLVMDWEATAWYAGKTKPTPEQVSATRKRAQGVALIDLRTGQVEVRPATKVVPSPTPPLPEYLEEKAVRWQGIVGKRWKVLALEEEEGRQRLVWHAWDRETEKAEHPKVLLQGKRLLVRETLDERILCLREASPSPDERASLTPDKSARWWSLYSVEMDKWIGRIPVESGMHALAVVGKRAFYLVPGTLRGRLDRPNMQARTLKAIDLESGKKLWERNVAAKLLASPPL
jgi:hypothetical protein